MARRKQTAWKKHWKPARSQYISPREKGTRNNDSFGLKNFESWLPEYYEGPTNRLIRYSQYDQIDMDHEVNAALDTIAEFSTLESVTTNLPFEVDTIDPDMSNKEVEIIQQMLRQWCKLNEFNKRMFRIFRNTIKYGDQFFVRDPETYQLMWIDPATVEKVQVNEAAGKEIEIYFVKDLDLNLQELVATNVHSKQGTAAQYQSGSILTHGQVSSQSPKTRPNSFTGLGSASTDEGIPTEVDATHVVHLSLTEGMDNSWPFGISILERIYKIFKQKELLEDAILIYRIHRAPMRRVFTIDVGDMPNHYAQEYLQQVQNQVNQKRIPSRNGEGGSVVDAAYNPQSILEDFYFTTNSDGRGSKVDTIGGDMDGLKNIDDLKYFNNKMLRALAVPSSYLPTGPEDGSQPYSDGRISAAFIQEFRFDRYCRRLQGSIIDTFDKEFKLYLKYKGIEFDSSDFELKFADPQNFSEYRQLELDQMRINVFNSIKDVPYVSNQYALKRYLGWTDVDMQENEDLWKMENRYDEKMEESGEGVVSERDIKQMDMDKEKDAADQRDMEEEMAEEEGDFAQDMYGAEETAEEDQEEV